MWLQSYCIPLQRYLDFPQQEKENAGGRGPVLAPLEGGILPVYHWQTCCYKVQHVGKPVYSVLSSTEPNSAATSFPAQGTLFVEDNMWVREVWEKLLAFAFSFIYSFVHSGARKPDTCWPLQSYFQHVLKCIGRSVSAFSWPFKWIWSIGRMIPFHRKIMKITLNNFVF